jgi:6-pyruvoyltetrahydropterin/6-carboxytetrahydropterin synthase
MHGHTWTVRAYWDFAALDTHGMGMNFRDLKAALREHIYERYDHRHLNDISPFGETPPTAENLAREVYRVLAGELDTGPDGRLSRVEIWEGPESCAAYRE